MLNLKKAVKFEIEVTCYNAKIGNNPGITYREKLNRACQLIWLADSD